MLWKRARTSPYQPIQKIEQLSAPLNLSILGPFLGPCVAKEPHGRRAAATLRIAGKSSAAQHRSVAEAGVEHSTKSSGKSRVGRQVVQKAVQGPSDVADIVRAVARLTPKRRAALLTMIDAAKAAGPKAAKP